MRDLPGRLMRRARLLALVGRRVECPCCGAQFRRFMVDERRRVLICPRCGSHERHRALWLFLCERLSRLGPVSVLHWAPERALEKRLRRLPGVEYTSADLDPARGMRQLDITAIDAPDASWDVIICSHVLEHVADDRAAMRQLRRVLRPDGTAIVLVPQDDTRATTHEDPSVTAPEDREREYWSDDHLRLYGRDFGQRLEEAGFQVEVVRPAASLDDAILVRHGLDPDEKIYVCGKPGRRAG